MMATSTVRSKEELIEELYRLPDNMKAEIIDGAIVPMSPTGITPSRVSGLIFASLLAYEKLVGKGMALPNNAGFIVNLPHRGSFSPDASYSIDLVRSGNFANGAPLFAAEVRSKGDYGPKADSAVLAKIADYFAAGTQVVWDVDALRDMTIRVYRAGQPDQPTLYGMDDIAEAEPALPGWRVAVNTLLS
jgi:Uma2 family endonuclease